MAGLSGVGLAGVCVPRFRAALERRGERLLERVFSPDERAYARRKRDGWQNLAARFAAKSAGRSALRRALGRTLPLSALEVVRKPSGEPTLVLRASAGEAPLVLRASAGEATALRMFLTMTHDADFALASVWVEAGPA